MTSEAIKTTKTTGLSHKTNPRTNVIISTDEISFKKGRIMDPTTSSVLVVMVAINSLLLAFT